MAVRLSIKVQPGTSRNRLLGENDGEWKIAVTAPPVDGRANAAVIKSLAEWLKVPRSAIQIVKGETSRRKIVEIEGISMEAASQRLAAVK